MGLSHSSSSQSEPTTSTTTTAAAAVASTSSSMAGKPIERRFSRSRSEKEGQIAKSSSNGIYSDEVGIGEDISNAVQGQGLGLSGMSGAVEYARRVEITLASALAKANGHLRSGSGFGYASALGPGLGTSLSTNIVPIVIPVRDTAAGLPPTTASLHDFWTGGGSHPVTSPTHNTNTNNGTTTSGGTPYTPYSAVNAAGQGPGRGGLAVNLGVGQGHGQGVSAGHYGHPSSHQMGAPNEPIAVDMNKAHNHPQPASSLQPALGGYRP